MRRTAAGRSDIAGRPGPSGTPGALGWFATAVLVACLGACGGADVPNTATASRSPAVAGTSGPAVGFDVGSAVLELTVAGRPSQEDLILAQARFVDRQQFPERLSFSTLQDDGTVVVYADPVPDARRLDQIAELLAGEPWVERVAPLPLTATAAPAAGGSSGPLASMDLGTAIFELTVAGRPSDDELFLAAAAFLRRHQFPERLSFSGLRDDGTVVVHAARAVSSDRLDELTELLAGEPWVQRVERLPRP